MAKFILGCACVGVIAVCAYFGIQADDKTTNVSLKLLDARSENPLAGMVRIFPADGAKPLELPGLLDRLRGLKKTEALAGWYVVPSGGVAMALPRGRYRIEALSGLETALTKADLDLTAGTPVTLTLKLNSLYRPAKMSLVAGNTHLHLQGLSKSECEDYLRQVPAADGIRVMFISYLERADIDKAYITNRYPIGDLHEFDATGVIFNNGEEHRHNFEAWGQGYGHVMFLDLKELVKPVSVGPGITAKGDDDRPLRPGIDDARKQGSTVIWCHNTLGHEDVPSALSGRLDALNVFDGSRGGTYDENYYRYLNVGTALPISTGTDWFIYDFSRVYARVEEKLTVKSWLAALKAGRNFVTNGPMLTLSVNGMPIGSTLKLDKPVKLRVVASGLGRHDFQKLQIVHNGRVVHAEPAQRNGDHYESKLDKEITVDGPGWLAARIDSDTKNELQQQLFAHTSPVYIEMAGQRILDVESGRALMKQMEDGRADIRTRGKFSNDAARDNLLAIYDEAIKDLGERIGRRSK